MIGASFVAGANQPPSQSFASQVQEEDFRGQFAGANQLLKRWSPDSAPYLRSKSASDRNKAKRFATATPTTTVPTPPSSTQTATATPTSVSQPPAQNLDPTSTLQPQSTESPTSTPTPAPSPTPVPNTATPIPSTPTQTSSTTPTLTSTPNAANVVRITNGSRFQANPQSNTTYECAPGVILDGENVVAYAFRGNGADNVTIRNCIIQNYSTSPQDGPIQQEPGSDNWIVENNEIRYNAAAGVVAGNGWIVRENYIHHNHQIGFKAEHGAGILLENNEVAFNNWQNDFDAGWEAGGSKFVETTGLTVRGNNVHDNHGPGLWTDINNRDTVYENNVVQNNTEVGIYHEISFSAIIRNNTVTGNGCGFDAWMFGGQITISTSSDVEIYGNTVASSKCGNGITVLQQNRGANWETRRIYVHDNDISGEGKNGAAEDNGDPAMFTSIRFDYNDYHGATTWAWDGTDMQFSTFQASGQEVHGAVD